MLTHHTSPTGHRGGHLRDPRRAILAALALALTVTMLSSPLLVPADAAVSPRMSLSATSVVAGATVRATVSESTRPTGSTLKLQRKHLDGWRVADGTPTRVGNQWRLRVPTDQFGTFRFRVVAVRDGAVVSRSRGDTVTVRPPYSPVGKPRQHTFAGSPPVRWDSCQKIRWTFNPRNAPRKGLAQVRAGVRRIHQATGLDFRYVGRTRAKPDAYGRNAKGADIIIGWRRPADYPLFANRPKTVGVGGNSYYLGYQEADGTRVGKAASGGVVLNAGRRGDIKNGFGRGYTWGEVIIHELGHVMGLSHTGASSQIMYFQTLRRNAAWGAGDLAGLRRLGDTRGCLRRVNGRVTREPQLYAAS